MSKTSGKKKRKWRFRFGLRTFLVLVCLICIVLGTWVARWQGQMKAVALFDEYGEVQYEEVNLVERTSVDKLKSLIGKWFGRDAAYSVVEAKVETDAQFERVKHFPGLKKLTVSVGPNVKSLEPVRNLTNLELLTLYSCSGVRDLGPVAKLAKLKEIRGPDKVEFEGLEAVGALPCLEEIRLRAAPVRDLSVFKHPESIRVLWLDGRELVELEPLKRFKSLERLALPNCAATDWSPVAVLEKLEKLILPGSKIASLEHLSALPNLRELNVQETQISNLEAVKDMELYKFEFWGSPISDLTPLQFTKLGQSRLNVFGTDIRDFRVLGKVVDAEITGINHLSLGGGFLKQDGKAATIQFGENDLRALTVAKAESLIRIEGLGLCRNIRHFSLREASVEDLSELSRCSQLKTLDLCDLPLSAFPDLSEAPLETLNISECPVANLSSINTKSLRSLTLNNTQLKDLGSLTRAAAVGSLKVSGKSLKSLEGCDTMRNLTSLRIADTSISTMEPLDRLTQLHTLRIYDSPIQELPRLGNKTRLQFLSIQNCPLQSLKGSRLSLNDLQLINTSVSDLEPLRGAEVSRIVISGSPVSDIAPLATCRSLQSLSLHDTKVVDFAPLKKLRTLLFLEIGQCKMVDLDAISDLSSLIGLNLFGCGIRPFSDVPTDFLERLNHLSIHDAEIEDYGFLKHCKNLHGLHLKGCNISDASVLKGLKSVGSLDLSHTQVTDFTPLLGLEKLGFLYVTVESEEKLSELRELFPQAMLRIENRK